MAVTTLENFLNTVADNSRASIEKDDLKILLPILYSIDPKIIIEIGMHKGYSMEVWRKAFNPDALLGFEKDGLGDGYYDEMHSYWGVDSHSERAIQIVESFLNAERKMVDFLFIDGDHSYNGVREDYEKFSGWVRPGGIIVLHDACYLNKDNVVKPFWEELKSDHRYIEIKAGLNSTGIGVILTKGR